MQPWADPTGPDGAAPTALLRGHSGTLAQLSALTVEPLAVTNARAYFSTGAIGDAPDVLGETRRKDERAEAMDAAARAGL